MTVENMITKNIAAEKVSLKPKGKKPISVAKKILYLVAGILIVFIAVQFINAAKYTMVVNVVDGKNVMGVNPLTDNLDFGDLSRENGMARYVTMKSSGNMPVYVSVWKFGDISDLVKVNKDSFILKPGQEEKLSFEIQIPVSAKTQKYSGSVWIFRLPKLL